MSRESSGRASLRLGVPSAGPTAKGTTTEGASSTSGADMRLRGEGAGMPDGAARPRGGAPC